jgi:hypothetical protein
MNHMRGGINRPVRVIELVPVPLEVPDELQDVLPAEDLPYCASIAVPAISVFCQLASKCSICVIVGYMGLHTGFTPITCGTGCLQHQVTCFALAMTPARSCHTDGAQEEEVNLCTQARSMGGKRERI